MPNMQGIWKEMKQKFQYLPDLQPDSVKSKINIFSKILTDEMAYNFKPNAYKFYSLLWKDLKTNPEYVKNMIYENKLIKHSKEEEAQLINKIVAKLNNLSTITDKNILKDDELYAKLKHEMFEKDIKNIETALNNVMKAQGLNENSFQFLFQALKSQENKASGTNEGERRPTGAQPTTPTNEDKPSAGGFAENIINQANMQVEEGKAVHRNNKETMLQHIDEMKQKFKDKSVLYTNLDKLNFVLDSPSTDNKLKAAKLQDVMHEIEDNEQLSINQLKLSKEDKLVFIGVTFLIRLIVLSMIDWSVNSNFIVTFTNAFVFYLVLYTIFLLLIVVVVNITFTFPIYDLYKSDHGLFSKIASTMYYFYLIPGERMKCSIKLILHIGLIAFITMVAILIKETEGKPETINYDYSVKKNIVRLINNYSLFLWFFTAIVAMKVN